MANPKIQVDITADASKLKKGAKEASDALEDLRGKASKVTGDRDLTFFEKLGNAANTSAKEGLGPLGDVADKLGVDLDQMSMKTLAAGAAIVGLGGFVAGGVKKLADMTAEVRKFNDTSGVGWDSSSRLVSVMDDLGVSADTGASAMGRLAKNIDAGKLAEFGIEAVRTKDGSVDLAATLGVVADQMNATSDPTKKAAMGTALFGKSWADLQPLLQQGSKGIGDAMGSVKDYQIVTAESAQEQREMAMAVDDMQDAFAGLQMNLAKGLIPALTRTASGISEILNLGNKVGGKKGLFDGLFLADQRKRLDELEAINKAGSEYGAVVDDLAASLGAAGVKASQLGVDTKAMADAEAEAADQTQILEARTKDAAEAAKELTKQVKDQTAALDIARESVMTVGGAVRDYQTAQLRTAEAADTLAEKQADATKAVNEFGQDSPEATKAQRDYEKATIDAVAAADDQAHAAANQAEKLAIAAGETFTAEQKNIVYRDSLNEVRDATNDPNFVAGMDNLIALTGDAAANADIAQRKLWDMAAAASAAALAAAGVGRTGGGDMASVTADNADRILSNQRLGSVTLEIDKRVLGTVMLPTLRDLERQRR